ncbi:peptidase dimerization domain-containing protein [Cupriavidus sp. RAF12]|uniref:peptidase dimerization domain-containing protein n=1 Tax=Cupriavidus sp. RAF12 TaxID=3233050 RepID=UPI003F93C0FE
MDSFDRLADGKTVALAISEPQTTFNITMLKAGGATNVIPDQATAYADLRVAVPEEFILCLLSATRPELYEGSTLGRESNELRFRRRKPSRRTPIWKPKETSMSPWDTAMCSSTSQSR